MGGLRKPERDGRQLPTSEREDGAEVEPAAEEQPDRYVTGQMCLNARLKRLPRASRRGVAISNDGVEVGAPEAFLGPLATLPEAIVSWRKQHNSGHQAAVGGQRANGEVVRQGRCIECRPHEARRQQAADFGSKRERTVRPMPPVKRLDPEWIAREERRARLTTAEKVILNE